MTNKITAHEAKMISNDVASELNSNALIKAYEDFERHSPLIDERILNSANDGKSNLYYDLEDEVSLELLKLIAYEYQCRGFRVDYRIRYPNLILFYWN